MSLHLELPARVLCSYVFQNKFKRVHFPIAIKTQPGSHLQLVCSYPDRGRMLRVLLEDGPARAIHLEKPLGADHPSPTA